MATDYVGERSLEQQIVIKPIEDPSVIFYDPDARRACREDSMWQGKIRVLSREQVEAEFGSNLKILNRSFIEKAAGWMAGAVGPGWRGDFPTTQTWTGRGGGPYYICEFY